MTTEDQWLNIRRGDILRAPSGSLRVIRDVTVSDNHRATSLRKVIVTMVIQRCSWTHRPYTVYSVGELIGLGYSLTGRRYPLRSQFDRVFQKDLAACKDDSSHKPDFCCCDVRGIG